MIPQGSAESGKASRLPLQAAVQALTVLPLLPVKNTCGRRTRKPPVGALSKETGVNLHPDSENLTREELTTEMPAHGK